MQIGLAWAAGVIIAPVAFYGCVAAALMGGVIGLQLAGVGIALGAVGLLFLLAGASKGETGLTSVWGWRIWWAILVFAGGMAAWVFGATMYTELGLSLGSAATLPLIVAGGAGFGLSAAILAGRWFTLGGVAVVAVLIAGGSHLAGLRAAEQREFVSLEPVAPLSEPAYTTSIEGYRLHHDGTTAFFSPQDQRVVKVWQDHELALGTARGEYSTKTCREERLSVVFGRSERVTCTAERPGLWYRGARLPEPEQGCPCGIHEYVMQRGTEFIRIGASDAVPKETLRDAIVGARPLTAAELRTPSTLN